MSFLLVERARCSGARSMRALEDQPGYPVKEVWDWEDTRSGEYTRPSPFGPSRWSPCLARLVSKKLYAQ